MKIFGIVILTESKLQEKLIKAYQVGVDSEVNRRRLKHRAECKRRRAKKKLLKESE